VLKPLKINLKIEGGALPKFKIPRYSATPGESVHDFIDVLTRHLGVKNSPVGISHTSDPQGNFVILTGAVGGSDSLIEGQNMMEGREVIYDPLQAGGVPSPNQGPGNDQQHGTKVASEPFKAEPFETYGQKYPPSVVVPVPSSCCRLPAVSVDHLGLSKAGFPTLLKLAEKGVRVKATGFGRVDFDVRSALTDLYSANSRALMFGTDLPSTRAPRPYEDDDYTLILQTLGEEKAATVFYKNAIEFYRPKKILA